MEDLDKLQTITIQNELVFLVLECFIFNFKFIKTLKYFQN